MRHMAFQQSKTSRSEATSLVIFDCDGVLVDSEPISHRILAEAISGLGLPMSAAESQALFAGLTLADVVKVVEARVEKSLPEDWLGRFEHMRAEAFKTELREVPGATEAVRSLRQRGIASCVASQARLEKSVLTLGLTGLLPYFEGKIFSASMVARPKPYPDLFLHAARTMGYAPGRCVVVEDTMLGIIAARAAGMRVLAYAHDDVERATLGQSAESVFDEMRELPALLMPAYFPVDPEKSTKRD